MLTDNKTVFRYGALEETIDTSDYLFMEKVEAAQAALDIDTDLTGIDTESARIKKVIMAAGNFFDTVFGDGAANKAFGATTSMDVALDAMAVLAGAVQEQSTSSMKGYNELGKYKPNRAQRRAKK